MYRSYSKLRLGRTEPLLGSGADGSAESGYALITLVVLMGFLVVLLTGAVLAEGNMRAINIKMGQARKALDLARGVAEEMVAALELNGYNVDATGTITKEDPSGEWVASASCREAEDGTIVVTATASVRKVNKKIYLKLVPATSLSETVLVCGGQIEHEAHGKSRMEIYGNVYCSQRDLPSEYFPDPRFGVITELPPGLIPDIGPGPFESKVSDTEFTEFPSGEIDTTVAWQDDTAVQGNLTIGKKGALIIAGNAFGFVDGDLDNYGSLVVDGMLYVRGSLRERHPNATVGGTGILVVSGSLEASLDSDAWDGLRLLAVGGDSSRVSVQIDNEDAEKRLFIYSSGDIELDVKKSLTLDPGLLISRDDVVVDLETGNTVLKINPGEFEWEDVDLPFHFGVTYSVADWTEEFGR
ncbi:MAG TPA: hypothetical protein GXX30_00135 [Firmicutes bacterium]|nr:hypothetical protein [Candidatus Fermentithermobacillaceae bacterium]